ncbi:MAG: amidase family protein [Methylovirgula sp.]|uniref:amidase family protein n=1 Tax=Methylovirgula sp. TaxID=1978224 RepID=UPI0030760F85
MHIDLWRWSAVDLAAGIRTRRISSREAVTSCLLRLDEVNPAINAVVDVMAEEALAAADRADAAVSAGEPLGGLHGVPVTLKINVDYEGRPTTNGVVAFADRVAKEDAPPVANWRKAGAIIIGRTNVPAFCARFFTDNALHGRTLNPWAPGRTPGGSSGGAAAALACGIGPLAHGNDRAGSIRQPAYACGVTGIRPSLGRVPGLQQSEREPTLISQLCNMQGPLARNIADLRLGLEAMARVDPRDPWWCPVPFDLGECGPTRVALFDDLPGVEIDPAVREALRKAASCLEGCGYHVEEAVPPRFTEAARLFFTLVKTEERSGSSRLIDEFGDDALRRARASTMATAESLSFEDYIAALARRTTILREWQLFMERYPLILMPVSWKLPAPVDLDQTGDAAVAEMIASLHPLLAISVLGLPGLAVPTGFADGVPVGVQLVASRFREDVCFAAGEIIEAQCGPAPIWPG